MRPNNSPWIKQLRRNRPIERVTENLSTDTVIVGGGIAGISTAYFILKHTEKKVILIEGGKVAHGATGHNAGQMTSYFEKQLSNIAKEFGNEMVRQGQKDIDSAWLLLEEMYEDAHLSTPFYQFTGYAGLSDIEEILTHLGNNMILKDDPALIEPIMISEESGIAAQIPAEYDGYYSVLPQRDILSLLETEDTRFVAALSARKGVMNSALFTEEVATYLLVHFADRFVLREESFVNEVILEESFAALKIGEHKVVAEKVILCTNGFEKFSIINHAGADIDKEFHHSVSGAIGYMAGYLDERNHPPAAISYIMNSDKDEVKSGAFDSDPYFYLTRRPFENELNQKHNLISVGGPDVPLEDTSTYSKEEHEYSEEAFQAIDSFLHKSFKSAPKGDIPYAFHWHGLMGYTPSGVRLIGAEPHNSALLYNLGCNGVGILPSIYGARRIARIVAGEKIERSIFDPKYNDSLGTKTVIVD